MASAGTVGDHSFVAMVALLPLLLFYLLILLPFFAETDLYISRSSL